MNSNTTRHCITGLLLVIALMLAACGTPEEGEGDSASIVTPEEGEGDSASIVTPEEGEGESAPSSTPEADEGDSASSADPGAAGIVAFDSTSEIDTLFVSGTRDALEKDGFEVLSQDSKGDPGAANTICTQYVTRQVNVIVVTTFALDQMAQCMSQTSGADIPVFYIGSPLRDGMAGSIDLTLPEPINDLFIQYVKDEGVTDILTLDYTPGTPCRVRAEYRDELLADLDVEVSNHEFPIPGQVVDSTNATQAWLSAHPADSGTFAIWSCSTDPSVGALAAIEQAGREDIPIYTWDFNKTVFEPLKAGEIAATLTLEGGALGVGTQIAGLVDDYRAGGEPKGVPAEFIVLTPENIEQFVQDNPDSLD